MSYLNAWYWVNWYFGILKNWFKLIHSLKWTKINIRHYWKSNNLGKLEFWQLWKGLTRFGALYITVIRFFDDLISAKLCYLVLFQIGLRPDRLFLWIIIERRSRLETWLNERQTFVPVPKKMGWVEHSIQIWKISSFPCFLAKTPWNQFYSEIEL